MYTRHSRRVQLTLPNGQELNDYIKGKGQNFESLILPRSNS